MTRHIVRLLLACAALHAARTECDAQGNRAEEELYRTQLAAAEALLRLEDAGGARSILLRTDPARRGWEWELLAARTDRSVRILGGHAGGGAGLAVSPDGKAVAAGSGAGAILLWDPESGKLLRTLMGHTGRVSTLDFSPDGAALLSGGTDKTLRVWSPGAGTQTADLSAEFKQGIYQARFSPDGTRIAAVSWERTGADPPVLGFAKLLDAAGGRLLVKVPLDSHPAAAVDFTPDGRSVVTATWGFHVSLHDAATGTPAWSTDVTSQDDYTALQSVDVSPDGRTVATGGKDARIRLFESAGGAQTRVIEPHQGHRQWVNAVRFSPDGRLLATGSDDGLLKVWDAATAKLLFTMRGHTGGIQGLAWFPDGRRIASAASDSTVRIWDLAKPGERSFDVCVSGPWNAPVTPDGRRLAAACLDRNLTVWDLDSGAPARNVDTVSSISAAFAGTGDLLAVAGDDLTVHLYDLRTGGEVRRMAGHTRRITGVALHEERGLGASAGDRTFRVWSLRTGDSVQVLHAPGAGAYAVQFSPDGRTLAAGCTNGAVLLYDTRTWKMKDSLHAGTSVLVMAVHPGGRWLLTGDDRGKVHVMDLIRSKNVREMAGHTKSVYGLAAHPTLPLAVSASYDRTARVWDLEKGICTLTLSGFGRELYTASIARGGTRMILTEPLGTVHVIDVPAR